MLVEVSDSSVEQWKQLCEEKMKELKKDVSAKNSWTYYMDKDNVKIVYKEVPNDPNTKYMGIGRINTTKTAPQFVQWLIKLQRNLKLRRLHVNSAILDATLLQVKQLDEENNKEDAKRRYVVEWLKTQSPTSLVSNRDFQIIMRYDFENDNEAFVIATSISHDKFPKDDTFVRSQLKLSGWHIRKPPGKDYLYCQFIAHTDPSGWVPAWVINQVMYDQVLLIHKYDTLIVKEEAILAKRAQQAALKSQQENKTEIKEETKLP